MAKKSGAITIPDMWLVGATHGGRRTTEEAVRLYLEQERLHAEFQKQRDAMDAQHGHQSDHGNHWVTQPRVPAGSEDGGEWTEE